MALSFNLHTDLSDNIFPFTFDYINTNDIYAIGRRTTYNTWVPLTIIGLDEIAKTVTVFGSLTAYDLVQVYRLTSLSPLVDFQNGARLTERDLDTAYQQGLFAAQEVAEDSNRSGGRTDISSDQIVDSAVITSKIANLAVDANKLSSALDLSSKSLTLPAVCVNTNQLYSDAVTGATIADNAVDSEHITAGAVDNSHLSGGIELGTKVTGVLTQANGGTGQTSLPITKYYSSTVAYPAIDTEVSVTHGFFDSSLAPEVPKMFYAQYVCIQATDGYVAGDVVNADPALTNGTIPSISVHADTTKVYYTRSIGQEIIGKGADDDHEVTIADTHWQLKLCAIG